MMRSHVCNVHASVSEFTIQLMTHTYYLEFLGEELELLQSTQTIGSEQEFFDRFVRSTDLKQLHLIEAQVTLLFDRFKTINHRSNSWCDNLKTLLAHGFALNIDGHPLPKTYVPLTFQLALPKANEQIHFGRFYRAIHELPEEQFIKFCRVTEYPPGIHPHNLVELGFYRRDPLGH